MGATLALSGAANPGATLLQRDLDFRALAWLRAGPEAAGLVVGLIWALFQPSAWALVGAQFAVTLATVVLSYVLHPYRPRLRFEPRAFAQGFAVGKHWLVIVALTFVTTQFDNAIVARTLGTETLGHYLLAYRLASLPLDGGLAIIAGVALPTYVRLVELHDARLAATFLNTLGFSVALLCATLLPLYLLSGEVVAIAGGPRFMPAAPLLAPLCILALLRGITQSLALLLHAIGRAGFDSIGKALEAAVFIPLCIWMTRARGASGAAEAGAVVYGLAVLIRIASVRTVLPGQLGGILLALARPMAAAAAALVVAAALAHAGVGHWPVAALAMVVFAAVLAGIDARMRAQLSILLR
jgi:PST family polysaccharide transporter/lipopolysaccharide exporter